ncbi:MAG: OmpH family outer membrane protein [Bacteroidales bacterium]|nr:OmpH family outer membrane protein [Bacteroidales bacterium]
MKRSSLIIAALTAMISFGAVSCTNTATAPAAAESTETTANLKGAIVFFNLDRVLNEYDMANDRRSEVEAKVKGISDEVNRRGNKLQKDVDTFAEKYQKGLLTSSVAEAQNQKLQQQQAEFQNYALQKEQEINEEQQVMLNQIADAIKTYLDSFQAEKGFAMILTTQGDILPQPVAVGDASLDVTDQIIAGLNAEYVKTKNSNK